MKNNKRVVYFLLFFSVALISFLLIKDIYNPYYSYIGDEFAFFDFAIRIIKKGFANYSFLSQTGVFGYHPVLDSLYQAALMKIFGINLLGWKIGNVIVVVASVLLVYKIAQELFCSQLIGLASAVFFGFSHYILAFAHIGHNNLHALIPFLTAILFFILYLKKDSFIYLFFSGLFSGLCFYTFFSARLILLQLLPFIFLMSKKKVKAILIYLVGFSLLFLPFYFFNQNQIFQMMNRYYFGDPDFKGLNIIGVAEFFLGLFFGKFINIHHYFVGPILNIVSAVFFFTGFFFLFLERKKRKYMPFLLFWFFIIQIVITIGFVNFEVPTTRLHIIMPAIAIVAGYGIVRCIKKEIFIFLFLAIYAAYELFFFYKISPTKYSNNKLSLLMVFAKKNNKKNVCTQDFNLDYVSYLADLYSIKNINSSFSCDVFIRPEFDQNKELLILEKD